MLRLPVSLGEAIDKLTILDIKREKIVDHRNEDVTREFQLLSAELKDHLRYPELYGFMKKVNLQIWNMMDELREPCTPERYLYLCEHTVELNDARFRIKNKINCASDSALKEQKSYKLKTAHLEVPEYRDSFADAIGDLSLYYDKLILTCSDQRAVSAFSYDPTIHFCEKQGGILCQTLDDFTAFRQREPQPCHS